MNGVDPAYQSLPGGGLTKKLKTVIDTKQDKLVSGENIKTINNESLLGSGNIVIPQGPKGDQGNSGYTGAAGELEVVNNLTQGGATAALSAEMGKELNVPLADYDKVVTYKNYSGSITSGDYRTIINLTALPSPIQGYVLLKGLDGKVDFSTGSPSWARVGLIEVEDGVITPFTIPSGANAVLVGTLNNVPVSSDTPFELTIKYGTIASILDTHSADIDELQDIAADNVPIVESTSKKVGLVNVVTFYDNDNHIDADSSFNYYPYTAPPKDIRANIVITGMTGTLNVCTKNWGIVLSSYEFTDGEAFEAIIPSNSTSFQFVLPQSTPTRLNFHTKCIYNDVAGRLGDLEAIAQNFDALATDYNRVTCFNVTNKIAAGQYRYVQMDAMAALSIEVYGDLEYSGTSDDVLVKICNSSWIATAQYEVTGNVKMRVVIPSNSRHLVVQTKDGQTVGSDQAFTLKLSYLLTDLREAEDANRREADEDNYNINNKYLPILKNLNRTKINTNTGSPDTTYKELVLQVITDIHDEGNAAKSFLEFHDRFNAYIDDMIGAGDYQNGGLNQTLHIASLNGWHDIIKAIGNHDTYTDWPSTTKATEQVCFETFMDGHIEDWGVVYQENKTYFYKDYADAKVRVVFLDYMHWDEANDADGQKAWLQNILYGTGNTDSALAKGYHVLIIRHCVPQSASAGDFVPFENCPFVSLDRDAETDFQSTECDIVNTFIQSGGHFVSWICGHAHNNWTGTYENYPEQLIIVQPCSAAFTYWRESAFDANTDYVNQFNLYGIDTKQKRIKVYRVGAVYDRNMQHTESLILSYDTTIENKVLHCF